MFFEEVFEGFEVKKTFFLQNGCEFGPYLRKIFVTLVLNIFPQVTGFLKTLLGGGSILPPPQSQPI